MKMYLAPMEGITGYAYRAALDHYFPGVVRYFTPFISAQKNLNSKQERDLDPKNNRGELIPQFMANRADDVIEMQKLVHDRYGYEEINLNFGCPSGTVVGKGHGSGFLRYPDQLDAFLDELFTKADFPISIKTRLGVENPSEWERILSVYKKYPLSELIIHPRLTMDQYKGKPRYEEFAKAVEELSIPLCFNGDIKTLSDYQMVHELFPSIDRVMIGRGFLRNPVLASEIMENRTTSDGTCNSWTKEDWDHVYLMTKEIRDIYHETFSGDAHVLAHLKELWSHLGTSLVGREKDLKRLKKSKSLIEYDAIVENLLKN